MFRTTTVFRFGDLQLHTRRRGIDGPPAGRASLGALALAALGIACHAHEPTRGVASTPLMDSQATPRSTELDEESEALNESDAQAGQAADSRDRSWDVRYRFPVVIGLTDFEPGDGEALDSLATLAVVPTADFVRPLSEEWTLIPFLGLGAGWLLSDDVGIMILTGGVRARWARQLDEATELSVLPRLRYDANLNQPDGFLGDWGRTDVAVELRHALGSPGDPTRLEPGVYAQGFWFWNDVEFDVPGLAPESIQKQLELGLSLGLREPIQVLGWDLPRIYLGVRFGDDAQTLGLRFGEL